MLESSCKLVAASTTETLKSTLNIQFVNEPAVVCVLLAHWLRVNAVQGPGVKREWFSVVTKEILNPQFGLFSITDSGAYQPSAHSGANPDHLSFFQFVGTMIGMAIYHEQAGMQVRGRTTHSRARSWTWASRCPCTSTFSSGPCGRLTWPA